MSVAEQAIADSRRILEADLLDIFFPDAGGNVLAASNADFYNAFLNLVGGGEAYRNRDGSVRQNLSPRIRAAVLAAMLNPERRETVERLLDNPEGYNALINGLMQSAANLAELANKPEYDLSGELSQAVELFVETRDKGQTVDEFAAQTDMFREAPSAETMFLMRLFEENAKSSGGISGVLRQYAAECKKIDTTTQSLFGEANPSKLEKLEEAYRHYAADLSNEAGNGNLRWRDTGEPTAEEISEAQKQYEEVKSKYMGTPLWMKAPNGKPTNLTEEQWVRVRTPNFKRWFGDWEKEAWAKAAMDFLEKTAPVRKLSGGEFQKDGVKLTDKVPAYFKSIGNVARNDELGDVVLDLKGVEDSIAHGVGRLKSAAFMAVPDVIEKGFIFNREENWKERGWNTAVIVAPIKLGEDDYVCEVVVKKVRGQQRFYLHEVEIKKTLDGVFKSVANNGNASQVSKLILGKHLAEVKGNVSKVVDENGEPKVVYHGSTAMFNEFRSKFIGHSTGTADGRGFYFTTDKSYAEGFKSKDGRVIEAFLNIRDTLDYKKKTIGKSALKKIIKEIDRAEFEADGEHYFISNFGNYYDEGIDKIIDEATESNYDFCDTDVEIFNVLVTSGADFDLTAKAIKDVTGKDGEIVPKDNNTTHFIIFNSNQIKSATDNIGTYSENPDIRWRLDEGAAELDARHAELYERYKGGDEAAYGEALELVADEARRNGYDVKVYHGTGADGFNVAKADASEAHYGEGAQAHGLGLYMAADRDTAIGYRGRANKTPVVKLGGKTIDYKEMGFSSLDELIDEVYELRENNPLGDTPKSILNSFSQKLDYWRAESEKARKEIALGKGYGAENLKEAQEQIAYIEEDAKKLQKWAKVFGEGQTIKDLKVVNGFGRVFDWLHNMKPDELLDEQLPFSKQNAEVKKKLRKLFKDNGKDLAELMKTGYVRGNPTGGQIYAEVQSVLAHGSEAEASRLLSKHGIRGITYDGRQDGRCFVSFEGGATVKLQDPFTFDDDGKLIPLSRRFDRFNPDMRWKIDDGEALERIRKLSAADIEGIMDEAERVVSDNLKESKGRSAAKSEADREKYIRDNMPEWKDNPDAFDEEDYAKGYRNYWNRRGYGIDYTPEDGWYSVVDENGDSLKDFRTLEEAEEYALERWWDDNVYDELDYKEDLYEDNPQNAMRKRFEYALRKIGIEIVNSTGGTFNGSEYIYLELPNGEEKKIRFADHPQVYSADMSVEEDWRAAFKFFVERVQREDWTEENYPDNIRWKIDDPSPERVEKLRAARPVEIGENDYKGLYELNAKSAFGYVMKHLRGKKYTISDTGEEVEIGQVGARKITTHDRYNKDYLRTFAAIPQMIENAVYLGEEPNEKGNSKYDKYRYYACGLKIGGRDYTARLTIGERNGKWYYDQALTEMEKGDLIEQVPTQASVLSARGSPNGFIDNRLISLLQENNSEKGQEAVSEIKRKADEWAGDPENVRKLAEEYLSEQKGQIVVDPDRIRAKLPNYEISLNSDFVEAGDKVLEAVWVEALKRAPKDKPVVLLTGNPAAGKGTAIKRGLLNEISSMSLVFDAPQNKFSSVEKRVREAADAGHAVLLIQIYNDPITSWKNSLERGIGKDDPKSGKRGGGRFLPIEYFVEGAYTQSQGKVEKIETVLKPKYGVKTKYIDNSGNNPIVVSPDEAKAWDYSISDSQLKEIERITDEYRGRIGESARLRGDKKDPLAVIRGELGETLLGGTIRISAERIPGRTEQSIEGTEQSLPGESGEGRGEFSRLKSLLRQERTENPVIWASIVLAKEILLGRAITNAKIDRVLPAGKFDGTKREYAINRAREIAERYRANREKFGEDLNLGVQRAESDLYWTRDVVEEMYASFRRDGEEYGIAKQKLFEWLKEQRRRDLEGVRGLSAEELGVDVSAAIENALEKEPERAKPAKKAAEEAEEETFEASGEGIDAEIESAREKPAPSSIRDIIGKIRVGVTKAAKARGMDEAARRRAYRNTLAEVLRESAKRLTYGREREAIMKKISDLSAKGYSVIKIKDGERAGQKIDNYTLRAEHIALRIFNRGVRDTKRELSEKFEKIVSRKGKKPSRMERDDKRALAGAVQMRVYNIKRYSEMDAAELEAEYSATVDRLENVEKNFAEDAGKGKVRSDIEDIRAEVANANAGEKLPSESARGIRGKSCIFATFIYRKFTAKFSPRKQAFPAPPAQIQFFSNLFKFTLTY